MSPKSKKSPARYNQYKKIKKGDEVVVLSGKDRGRRGKVLKVFRKEGKVLVEGINKVKKHVKPQGKNKPGGIVEIQMPLHISKVMVICPSCQKPTRVGFQISKENQKYRICKKCGGLIDKEGKK